MISLITQLFLLTVLFVPNESYYSRILDKADNVLYLYPKNGESIADVDWCDVDEPCAVVSKRFWLPRQVIRPCRCKNIQCMTQYSTDPMKTNTIQLDNRSQFKMCESDEVERLIKRCSYGAGEIGVSVEETRKPADSSTGMSSGPLLDSKVSVYCRCVEGYWQLSRHTLDKVNSSREIVKNQYHCNKLSRCKKNDFCGHIRADTHTAYYRCSCPKGSLCINTDRELRNASELLYEGPMYRAYCQPIPTASDNRDKPQQGQ